MSSPTTLENVLYEKKDGIAYVTVNRPRALNALNRATWENLRTAFADARDDAAVRVRLVDPIFGQLLWEKTARFNVDRSVSAGPFTELPARPGYIEIGGITDNLPELPNVRELRLEIEPLTAGLRYWAFVSTTNNATQQVTLITPQ